MSKEKSMSKSGEKQIALVLQGGGGMGAYEVGALKAIVKHAVEADRSADRNFFNVVAGSSIGAINGAILVQEFVKNKSWTRAVNELENFWLKQIASESFVDTIPSFSDWWQYWSSIFGDGSIANSEAARRYYSALQFWLFGIPGLVLSSTNFDNRFLNPMFNFLQRGNWSPLGLILEKYKQEQDFRLFPIKTDQELGEPRLLTTAIDVKNGSGVIFDSYSEEVSYSVTPTTATTHDGKRINTEGEIKIKYPGGLRTEHIMASAAVPANSNYAIVKDENSSNRMYWDGAFASNTPFRGLIQSHRDWYLAQGKRVPDLDRVYIIGLWPRKIEKLPIPPDNNFVWSRMWDLIFDDKTTYVEKTAEIVTDYLDIIEKLLPLAEENGHKEEVKKFLEGFTHSRHRDGNRRNKEDLLKGRFKIGTIHRIEMSGFQDSPGLKIFDFSKKTIEQLLEQGYNDAMAYQQHHQMAQAQMGVAKGTIA